VSNVRNADQANSNSPVGDVVEKRAYGQDGWLRLLHLMSFFFVVSEVKADYEFY